MLAIFDIDGVLADDSKTIKLNPANPLDMDKFNALVPSLKPREVMVRTARALSLAKVPVYIFTARSERVRNETEDWLYAQGIDFKQVYMRPINNNDTAVKLKTAMFNKLLAELPNIKGIVFFEDNPAVCAAVRRNSDIQACGGWAAGPGSGSAPRTGITVCEVQ